MKAINNSNYKELLFTLPDFITLTRYKNSLANLLNRYPEGVPEHIISEALGLTEQELSEEYKKIIACFQDEMGV